MVPPTNATVTPEAVENSNQIQVDDLFMDEIQDSNSNCSIELNNDKNNLNSQSQNERVQSEVRQ